VSSADHSEGGVNTSPLRRAWREGLSAETRALLDEDERFFLRQSLSTRCLSDFQGYSAPELADRLLYDCLARGLSFTLGGGNVITLCPPLTIAEDEFNRAFAVLDEALAAAAGRAAGHGQVVRGVPGGARRSLDCFRASTKRYRLKE
jgi:hypothetical protein